MEKADMEIFEPPVCSKNEENPTRGVEVRKIRKREISLKGDCLNNSLKGKSLNEKKKKHLFYGAAAEASATATKKYRGRMLFMFTVLSYLINFVSFFIEVQIRPLCSFAVSSLSAWLCWLGHVLTWHQLLLTK